MAKRTRRHGDVDYNEIERWLLPLLRRNKLSVETFANRCGLSRAAVYFYLKDTYRPTVESMAAMCKVLGRPLSEGLSTYTDRRRDG